MRRLFLILLLPCVAFAKEGAVKWDQFRGPNGSGVAEDARPPIKLDASHLAWKTPIPPGLSSPVHFENRIFLTALDKGRLVTLAFDKTDGKPLWRREAPEVELEKVHETSSPATPTPLVDADRVYVYFGSYGLLCYDHEGKELWKKPIPTPKSLYGMSTSPISYGDNLILVLDNDANIEKSKLSQSKIVCLKKSNGDQVWEAPRPFHRSGWSTPAIWKHDKGTDLVVLGNSNARGYDPESGEEKWHTGGFSRETVAVPVFGNGHVYIASSLLGGGGDAEIDPAPFWNSVLRMDANKDGKFARSEITEHFTYPIRPELPLGHPGYGIPLPKNPEHRKGRQKGIFGWVDKDKDGFWTKEEFFANLSNRRGKPLLIAVSPGGKGDITKTHIEWELNRGLPEVPSPLFYKNRIYLVRNGGVISCINAADGDILYRDRLGGSGHYSASPVAANGHLYAVSNRGVVSVVKAGDEFEVAHEYDLGEPVYVTPALDSASIYFRTGTHLMTFRAKE